MNKRDQFSDEFQKIAPSKYWEWFEVVLEYYDDKLHKIESWCDAYPIEMFPEPDLKKAHEVLKANGMTLDAISASAMRHVLDGIRKIVNE